MDLNRLLEEICDGDSDAVARLYDAFAPKLWRRLGQRYAYLGTAELEDLLQDTFVLVLRHQARLLSSFAGRSAGALTEAEMERFLWGQACGLASNRRRASRSRRFVGLGGEAELVIEPDSERATVDRDLLQRLLLCIRLRSSRIYLYFQLRYRDGLSPEEIAQATGWSRKQTYRLRQILGEALETCREELAVRDP